MSLSELIYYLAFSTYMVGAAWSLRSDGDIRAVILFTIGGAMDAGVTLLAMFGPEVFDMGATGRNFALDMGVVLGVAVWLLVIATLLTRFFGRRSIFHVLTVATQLVWFTDYLAFLFGLHVYPMV